MVSTLDEILLSDINDTLYENDCVALCKLTTKVVDGEMTVQWVTYIKVGDLYYSGRYFNSQVEAVQDYVKRIMHYRRMYAVLEA